MAAGNDETRAAPLRRLWAGGPMPLFGPAPGPTLFPQRTAAARRAAEELQALGWIVAEGDGAARLTDAGRDWLLRHDSPRLLLEDLVRAAEAQAERLAELEDLCRRQRQAVEAQAEAVAAVLARCPLERSLESAVEDLAAALCPADRLADGALPELFTALRRRRPAVTVGQFHDALRILHAAGAVRLSPWTGALPELPEPSLALLIGHEVLYYVRSCRRAVA